VLITLEPACALSCTPPVRRYECYWEREETLGQEIASAWSMHKRPKNLGDIASNLQGVMSSLHEWSGRTIGSIPNLLKKKRNRLENLSKRHDRFSREEAKKVRLEINELLEKEELRWRQRSRVSWLRAGDRNTSFFHRTATWRQKKNRIEKLQMSNGVVTTESAVMEHQTTEFFRELYTADRSVQPTTITQYLQTKVDGQTNDLLCAPFTDEEISFALFQIGPTKAPGPDGFPAAFFQRNWATIKEDIITAVRNFF
jgi:hypothetical protein